jgi:hypothetical protein
MALVLLPALGVYSDSSASASAACVWAQENGTKVCQPVQHIRTECRVSASCALSSVGRAASMGLVLLPALGVYLDSSAPASAASGDRKGCTSMSEYLMKIGGCGVLQLCK